MKQLISATLSEEAAQIYNSWEKHKKSARISEMIIKEDINMKHIEALKKRVSSLETLVRRAMIKIHLKEGKSPLLEDMNESLSGTIYYQYWD